MSIAVYSIEKKTVTLVMTLLVFLAGILSYNNLSRLEDPEFTIKDALVVTRYPGATPEQVEREVTDVLETEIQRMPQVKEIKSTSKAGESIITVSMQAEFGKEELPEIWQQLRSKVNDAAKFLPPGAKAPTVMDDFGDVYGIVFALIGDGFNEKELYEYAKFLRRELLLVKDVGKIDLWGVQQESIYVQFSRAQMSQSGYSLAQLYSILEEQNKVEPAGKVKVGSDYIRIEGMAGFNAVKDIENLIIGGHDQNNLIYLKNMATVTREYVNPPTSLLHFNGDKAVGLAISTTSGGNVVTMGEAVQQRLDQLQSQIPVGLEARPVIMQSDAVTRAIDGFVVSLIEAVAIVVVVLLVFMGVRAGLIIGVVLMVTVIATFSVMDVMDVALERISLGALIIALGMLVDNAIVVTEGMLVRIRQGEDRIESAKVAVQQTMWPLLGATFIAILAFAAIGLSDDVSGEYCRSLFQVMMVSLLLSWVLAITLTPLLCYWLLPGPDKGAVKSAENTAYNGMLFVIYRRILDLAIQHRFLSLALAAVALTLGTSMFFGVKTSFFPKSTMPYFMVNYWLPEGTDIRQTTADISVLEKHLLKDERIESVTSFVGLGPPRFLLTFEPEKNNESYAGLLVKVHDHKQIDALQRDMNAYMSEAFVDAEVKMQKFNLGPSPQSSVEVRFSGPDPEVLRTLAEQAKGIIRDQGGVVIRDNWRQRVKVVRPIYAEKQAQFAGVSRSDLNQALETNFSGTAVGVYREGNDLIPIVARAQAEDRLDISQIGNVQIWSQSRQTFISIYQAVSGFETAWEDALIQRLDRKRTITAGGEPMDGELASELLARVKPAIDAIELPLGYAMVWGGEYEASRDAQGALLGGIYGSAIMMVVISILLFNTIRHPLIIWMVVPLSIIGVAVGLVVTGQPFGFMPLLGFLSLSGMLIKNAIVLLEQINIELAEGKPAHQAVLDASVSRCRPVLMAAGTTVLGMVPLLFDDFFVGMGITIMSGLTFASLLTLIMVPLLYSILFKVPNRAQVSPA